MTLLSLSLGIVFWAFLSHHWRSGKLAFEFADEDKIEGFSEDKEMAGTKWFSLFLKCHSELKVKHVATNLSLARAMGSTNTIIENWFDQYEDLVAQLEIDDPAYIWNIDKHRSKELHKVKRVVGIKGVKQFQVQPHVKKHGTL